MQKNKLLKISILCSHKDPENKDKILINSIIDKIITNKLDQKIQIFHGGSIGTMMYLRDQLTQNNIYNTGVISYPYINHELENKSFKVIRYKSIFSRFEKLVQSKIILTLPNGGEGTEAELRAALTTIKVLGWKQKNNFPILNCEKKTLCVTGKFIKRTKNYLNYWLDQGNTSFISPIVSQSIHYLSNNIPKQLITIINQSIYL